MYDDLRLEHSSTVDRAADEIRRALFAGQIPPGTPLRELALSEAMGVGRSTIREALGTLVAEGLAVRAPNRGVSVKALSDEDVHDVLRARAALESAGVRGWPDATDDERQAVRDAVEEYSRLAVDTTDVATLTRAHLDIHRALVGLTGSRRLIAAADALSAEIRLGLADVDRTRGNLAEQVANHRRLVELLDDDEIEAAGAELEDHLAAAQVSLLDATRHARIEP
ncbi:MAG: GntR family transcriptional regulator [Nocardioidaceae bacterium]